MKKKIIFVTKALWIGGIETALVNLLKNFNYDKYDVTLLVLKAELDMRDQIHSKCRVLIADREKMVSFQEPYKLKRLYYLTEEPEHPSGFHKMMMWTVPVIRWIENRFYIRYIKKMMQKEQFDTVIIYSDVAGETAVKAIKADKYLMFYHHGAMRHVYHDKIAYEKCEKIITVSENQAKELKKFTPRYANKVIAIHNLINIDEIRKKSKESIEEVFDRTKFNIVSVGRVSHEKGMDLAVEACSKLVTRGKDNIRWWIVGDGPAIGEVRETIRKLHMEQYVIIVGMKSNPYPYIRQADLYVQPSRFEGYPMTILEALVLGQPVVSTNNGGATEIICEGMSGILEPVDAEKIANGIEVLLLNPEKHKDMRSYVEKLDFQKENTNNLNLIESYI